MYRIAFFSDFHLRKVDEDFHRALALIRDAVNPDGDVCADHVVITGDIVDCAQIDVLEMFAENLAEMNLISSGEITVVPGNHDNFPWSKEKPFLKPSRPTGNWEQFCRLFGRTLRGRESKRLIRGEVYPVGKKLTSNAVLTALDSTRNNTYDPFKWASGELPQDHVDAIKRFFSDNRSAKHRIVVMHHCPWADLYDSESPLFPMGMAIPDSRDAVRWLKAAGTTLILCGHYHTLDGVKRKQLAQGMLGFRAGTAGGADEEEIRAYHVINLQDNGRVIITVRRFDPSELMFDWIS